jgi:anaerobic ribonucleoside-triphosphate reductase activating protein
MRLGLSRLHAPVTTLGPGKRIGIWLQGCSIHCPGCISRDTWPIASDAQQVEVSEIVAWCDRFGDEVSGITFSGGEPLDQAPALIELIRALRDIESLAKCDLLLYTGYQFDHARSTHPEIFELIDAAITEPYMSSQPTELVWRGSANQQLRVFTDRGQERYGESLQRIDEEPEFQVSSAGGALWAIGIPRRRGFPQFKREMANKGVDLKGCSWQV